MPQAGPIALFLSYAHEDEPFCQECKKHLSLLQRQGFISTWYDRQITAGADWAEEIDHHLERASIILLLITADFLASDYCYSKEMTRALQRHQADEAKVIPVLVRPCDWSSAPFARLQILPTDARPISTWLDKDEAWTQVVTEIRRTLEPEPSHTPVSTVAAPPSPAPPSSSLLARSPSSLEQCNRLHFLTKLHHRYSEMLRDSLQGAAQIGLELHSKPDAVLNNTRLRLRQANVPEYALPAGTTLLQVFDCIGGELLVLGEPGAGKTTLLFNLAEALYQRAEQDEDALIPAIVNLSTWASTRKPLAEWLIEEIMKSYDVPRGPITRWVQQNQLLLLLDGLDEVDAAVLPACIEAINTFKQQHLLPLVVCCRTAEYDRQHSRLTLQDAVVIQPLEAAQVDAYFKAAGKPLAGIRSALRKNAQLRELVSTPLMLHVVTLAYRDGAVQALPKKGTMEEQQQQIFEQYVQRMLAPRHRHFACQSMLHWLCWLARQMRLHNVTVFYLEHLQPEWLPPGQAQQTYELLAVRFYGVLLGLLVSLLMYVTFFLSSSLTDMICYGLMGGLVGGLISGNEGTTFRFTTMIQGWKRRKLALLSAGIVLCIGMSTGYAFSTFGDSFSTSPYGYIFGLSAGVCAFLLCSSMAADSTLPMQQQMWWKRWLLPGLHMDHLRLGAMVGVLFGLSYGLMAGLSYGLSYGLSHGLSYGLLFGSGGTVLSLLLRNAKRGITLTEIVTWSLPRLAQSLFSKAHISMMLRLFLFVGLSLGLIYGLSVGLSQGLIYGLSLGLSQGLIYGLSLGLSLGLSYGLSYWLLLGTWNSLSQETLDDHRRSTPNQGVKRSVRNGTLLGLLAGVLCGFVLFFNVTLNSTLLPGLSVELSLGLSEGLSYGLSIELSHQLSYGLIGATTGALLVWLVTGGLAGVRHLLLRLQLARAGLLPWRTVRFLDEATRCIVLYRDGGGYRFIHRLLLDYFADLPPSSPPAQPEPREDAHRCTESA